MQVNRVPFGFLRRLQFQSIADATEDVVLRCACSNVRFILRFIYLELTWFRSIGSRKESGHLKNKKYERFVRHRWFELKC